MGSISLSKSDGPGLTKLSCPLLELELSINVVDVVERYLVLWRSKLYSSECTGCDRMGLRVIAFNCKMLIVLPFVVYRYHLCIPGAHVGHKGQWLPVAVLWVP